MSGHPQKRNDQNKARKGRSFYNHPTFQRRAGLTARMVFPIQQRHQNVHPCQTAQHKSSVKRKTRRGNRNSAKQRAKFEHWRNLRKNNRRNWRKFKQIGSTAMRKVVAASLLGTATQEPSLLKQTLTLEEYRSNKYADGGTLAPNQVNKLCKKKKLKPSPMD